MGGIGARCRISGLIWLICVVLLSATVANGIRTGVIDGTGAPAPTPTPTTTVQAAIEVMAPPVAAAAAAAPPEEGALDGPYKNSKRKVPNGPDPIHNRRARWGDAPAKRV